MGLPPSNYNNGSIASTPCQNSSSVHSQNKKQFCSPNPTIHIRPTLLMKDKKKGFQQSAIIAESLETSDSSLFRPIIYLYVTSRLPSQRDEYLETYPPG